MYDYTKHRDFKKYFDTTQKRNIWVLGYFGGGSVNIVDAYELAKKYAEATNTPLETVKIDEILYSRRYKHFKYIFSSHPEPQQKEKDAAEYENVYQMLSD